MITVDVDGISRSLVDAAMESIGFHVTVQGGGSSSYHWRYDDITYIWIDFSYGVFNFRQGFVEGEYVDLITTDVSGSFKICYELLPNNGIAIGFSDSSDTPLLMAWIGPKSANDGWIGAAANLSIADASRLRQIDFSGAGSPYNDANESISPYSNDVQIVKAYNMQRFMDNIHLAILGPNLSIGENVRAVIGDTEYLIIGSGQPCKLALELPS